ncbi:hypothetical protein N7450_003783 [Penicillium hetheringtonii]|uniref:Uncharacterized protein n=1 Tax=Penicillium hetheringtonii TaxID=911720 RepID=A0AAD6DNU3_9EURO|nr:hypothetical protein N7450_003783 [Penicillium hetheringtonii]
MVYHRNVAPRCLRQTNIKAIAISITIAGAAVGTGRIVTATVTADGLAHKPLTDPNELGISTREVQLPDKLHRELEEQLWSRFACACCSYRLDSSLKTSWSGVAAPAEV